MQPGDRLICAFIRPIRLDDSFQHWPLHVTIVPWFRLPDATEQLTLGLATALSRIEPFTAVAAEETMMGPRRNRPALLLAAPTPFDDVEQRVRTYLHKKRAWLVDETTKIRRPFRPHVTHQQDDRLSVGDRFRCDGVYLVAQMGGIKVVVGAIPFKV